MNNTKPDIYQQRAIYSQNNTLLIAAAGSGKTYTIIKKIEYLINNKNILPSEILVISFTNKSVNDLKEKIKENVNVYTFHKLAIDVLKYNNIEFKIASNSLLDYICKEYFYSLDNELIIRKIIKTYHYTDYKSFLNSNSFKKIVNIITTFIHLYKTNNKTIEDLKHIYSFNNLLGIIIINILYLYNNELISTNTLDFDDLVIQATNYIKNYHTFKYIIIDEFQDTSLIRWNLVNEIRKNSNAIIFCVGDDYQSIFKFSGSNLDLFLNFKNLVDNANIMYLKYTYRNSQELINVCSSIIIKNKKQIKKDLISNKNYNNPIVIKYFFNPRKALKKLLDLLIYKYDNILILGRNNFDINKYLIKDYKLMNDGFIYKNKKVTYLSVHSSKGLEADVVIIINLIDDIYGFPNKIIDNEIINYINEVDQKTILEEERRLFYVALTRTKNEVYLLTPFFKKSIFVKEIKSIIKK